MFFCNVQTDERSGLRITDNEGDIRTLRELENVPDDAENSFEIIDESGDLTGQGTIVLNNIPISEEGRKAFVERFLGRARAIEETPGFIAIKVLRPLTGNVYVVLTQWALGQAFRDWQSSSAYSKAHKKRHTKEGLDQHPGVLAKKPFHKVYLVKEQ